MAEDKILVRYQTDISQAEKALSDYRASLIATEEAGETAFTGIGAAAGNSATGIGRAADAAQKMQGATKGLQTSINQISRELPAFTMNLNTGFMAISNNLPMLADAIANVKKQNAELAAQGKKTESVLKSVTAAIFSWQTALSVGITLLTVYGAELFKVFDNTKKLEAEQKRLANSTDMANKAFEIEERRLRALGVAELDLIAKKKERVKQNLITANQELKVQEQILQETLNKFIEAQSAAAQGGIVGLYKSVFAPSEEEIQAVADQLQKVRLKRDELSTQILELDKKAADKRKEQRDKENKEREEEEKKRNAMILEYEDILIKAQLQRLEMRLDDIRKAYKDIQDETALLIKNEINKGIALAEIQKLEAKTNEEKYTANVALIEAEYQAELENLAKRQATREEYALLELQTEDEKKKAKEKLFQDNVALKQKEIDLEVQTVSSFLSIQQSLLEIGGANQEAFLAFQRGVAFTQMAIDTAQAIGSIIRASTSTSITPIEAFAKITAGVATILANIASARTLIENNPAPPRPQLRSPNVEDVGFADGVVDLRGPGTETSDSIPAWLSRGESVIKASSTKMFKDELLAMNKNPINYEKLIEQKYVIPAIEMERRNQANFAENIARSISLHNMFSDDRIVKTLEKNKPATSKDIAVLAESINKSTRLEKFRGKLIKQK